MRIIIVVGVVFALLAGCSSDVANRYYGGQKYAEKPVSQVEVLSSKPARDFIVIADFQSRGETARDFQVKAAKIGADAVIVTHLGGLYSRDEQWAGNDTMANSYSHLVGTAIRYKE